MAIEVKVPVLPESVSDATVASWHVKVGDTVKRDQNILDLETDKVVLEVPAPEDGVIKNIVAEEGAVVVADQLLATIEAGAVETKSTAKDAATKTENEVKSEASPEKAKSSASDELSPSARRAAAEHQIDPTQVTGTGKAGRVTKQDVLNAVGNGAVSARFEKRVPMSRLRARVAERLLESQRTTAMLTTFNEIDLHAVMALRKQYKDQFEKTHNVKLGFMSFFTKAACEALKRFPDVNASIDGTDIIYHDYFDIGIAVSSPRGLVVPILRNADQMKFADVEKAIGDAAVKAKTGKLTVEEMTGGTFTITNGGVFGSLISTPILNPPQSAILGMHKIEERAVVVNGEIVIRPMMYVALSYDHRIIDGKESVSFLVTIKNLLEDPARLLLDL